MLKENSIKHFIVPNDYDPDGKHHQTVKDDIIRKMDKCTVIICIVGTETYSRPHVDWELYNGLKGGPSVRKGIIAVLLEERGDNKNAIESDTFPTRLLKNNNYVIFEQYASINARLEHCIEEAECRSRENYAVHNPSPMPLRNKRIQN